MNDPVIFPCREEIKPEAGISPEGRAALALAYQEKDAREGLCDYPAPVEGGDDDPDPPAAPTCEYCGATAGLESRICIGELVWCCADGCDDGPEREPGGNPELEPDPEPRRIVGHVGPVRVESWIQEEPTEETLPEDLPGATPPGIDVALVELTDGTTGWEWSNASGLYGLEKSRGAALAAACEAIRDSGTVGPQPSPSSSTLSDGGTELLTDHLDPLPTPPRPWWWTALCVLREQGNIEQQIAYLESVIRTEARRLVPTAPPDDPDPHPALRPLTGPESVELYRAAVHVGRLEEVFAAANRPARLRELYSVLCGGGR